MVQKKQAEPPAAQPVVEAAPKRRGRPRAYQPEIALGKALELFRKDGFSATSLDDLSAATGMNRPSLYGAFGDKRKLYIKSYQRHRDEVRARLIEIFREPQPIREQLRRIYNAALDMYLSGDEGPRGCFTVMTVASEAVFDPDIRGLVLEGFGELDKTFLNCFQRARDNGELSASSDPDALAQLASATLHFIAIRARAQVPRKQLEATVDGAIDVMVGK